MFTIQPQCDSCGECRECCPIDGAIDEGSPYTINTDLCAECGACVDECPQQAIVEQ
ncbi:4Fe-4S binding protein [Vibrio sp.]|nr:4Fe-4S binding protein [Vibrio sp.]